LRYHVSKTASKRAINFLLPSTDLSRKCIPPSLHTSAATEAGKLKYVIHLGFGKYTCQKHIKKRSDSGLWEYPRFLDQLFNAVARFLCGIAEFLVLAQHVLQRSVTLC